MKKLLSLALAILMVCTFCACGDEKAVEPEKPKTVTSTENFKLDGLYVDDSYRDSDNSPRRALYMFFTIDAKSQNIDIDSKYMDITIGDTNTYSSEVIPSKFCTYAPNIYYGGYIENVYVGESKKVATVFLVPEGDLVEGKDITIKDSQIPGIEEVRFSTSDIVHLEGDESICEQVDPEGCAEIREKFEPASAEVEAQVKNLINGYYWEAYVNPTWYEVEFSAPNNFVVKTSLGENGGTYSVRKGYIFCTYSSNGVTVEIPYEIVSGDVQLDLGEAFAIN